MLLHLVVQVVQALLNLAGRILLDHLAQVVRRQVQLVRDVLVLVTTFDPSVYFLKKILISCRK
jgi:hypothetical protein